MRLKYILAIFVSLLLFGFVGVNLSLAQECDPTSIDCEVDRGGDDEEEDEEEPDEDIVPIELVQLCLVSVEPIVVTFPDCEENENLIELKIDLDEITPPAAEQNPFLLEIEDVFSIRGRGTVPVNRVKR